LTSGSRCSAAWPWGWGSLTALERHWGGKACPVNRFRPIGLNLATRSHSRRPSRQPCITHIAIFPTGVSLLRGDNAVEKSRVDPTRDQRSPPDRPACAWSPVHVRELDRTRRSGAFMRLKAAVERYSRRTPALHVVIKRARVHPHSTILCPGVWACISFRRWQAPSLGPRTNAGRFECIQAWRLMNNDQGEASRLPCMKPGFESAQNRSRAPRKIDFNANRGPC
jgi:hypothetical protein